MESLAVRLYHRSIRSETIPKERETPDQLICTGT
jgi:hypothetical protein